MLKTRVKALSNTYELGRLNVYEHDHKLLYTFSFPVQKDQVGTNMAVVYIWSDLSLIASVVISPPHENNLQNRFVPAGRWGSV